MDILKGRRLVLASGSPRRKELLALIGLRPEVRASDMEENVTTAIPWEAVMELSFRKASCVAAQCPQNTILLGADTVVSLDGKIMGKPAGCGEACEMIRGLQGRSHKVYTGVTLLEKGLEGVTRTETFYEETTVWVYPMTDEEICAYVQTGEPLDKAGAYGIQGSFAAFIEKIEGDYYNVVGLPVGGVYQRLKIFRQ